MMFGWFYKLLEELRPDSQLWVFMINETQPLCGFTPDNKLALMFWSTREKAEQYRPHDPVAQTAQLVPWTLRYMAEWCKQHNLVKLLPDIIQASPKSGVVMNVWHLDMTHR